jgi:hypothetical protein
MEKLTLISQAEMDRLLKNEGSTWKGKALILIQGLGLAFDVEKALQY